MSNIQISGLTQHQVRLLDIMWQLKDMEDLEEWCETLSVKDQQQVDILAKMLVLAVIDDLLTEDTAEANTYLKKFRL
jgi:hypothetical protein